MPACRFALRIRGVAGARARHVDHGIATTSEIPGARADVIAETAQACVLVDDGLGGSGAGAGAGSLVAGMRQVRAVRKASGEYVVPAGWISILADAPRRVGRTEPVGTGSLHQMPFRTYVSSEAKVVALAGRRNGTELRDAELVDTTTGWGHDRGAQFERPTGKEFCPDPVRVVAHRSRDGRHPDRRCNCTSLAHTRRSAPGQPESDGPLSLGYSRWPGPVGRFPLDSLNPRSGRR